LPTSDAVVIADASPFVHLDRIRRLDLLPAIFGRVAVPAIIASEVSKGGRNYPGIDLRTLAWVTVLPDRSDPDIAADPDLHVGEIAALSLARATPHHLLVIDDLSGRTAAQRLGLRFIGTAGAIIRARKAGIIPAAAPILDALAANGFRLGDGVRQTLLRLVGEA
jgi:predicted nucleic acid-binding protein